VGIKDPTVSIGMPVYNCEKTVATSIQSILNQTFTDWELIVIDDGSRDETFATAAYFRDPRIRIIDGRENLGLPDRLNQAVRMSVGKYFARMDGDDIAYPERLAKQISFLDQHPEVDLLATSMSVFKDDGSLIGLRPAPVSHAAICAHPWAGFPMAHPTWMGKTGWFRVNPYRGDAVRMEDQELLFRTYTTSTFACLNEVLLAYRENSLSLKNNLLARRNVVRALWQSAGRSRKYWMAARGTLAQLTRALLDTAAISAGLDYKLLRHRARPVPSGEVSLVRPENLL
jgi:glycosyltransferase involved in cell wall biosynthesis